MTTAMYGLLAAIAFLMVFVVAAVASSYVQRLRRQETSPLGEEIGSAKRIIGKVRKREPMTQDELDYARQIVGARGSVFALAIPGTLFMLGCFFVLGSLEHLHGATPSERTFLGVIPMVTSTSLAIRILNTAKLKRRLKVL